MTERTLVLVKPDGVQRQLTGRILARYEERGLKLVGLKLVQVSRATADKFVMLPSRQVVPFALFFKASLSVQDVLREIVDGEAQPLTDAEIQAALADRGYRIARRTVAKYRNEMGILPSSLR